MFIALSGSYLLVTSTHGPFTDVAISLLVSLVPIYVVTYVDTYIATYVFKNTIKCILLLLLFELPH